MNRITTTYSELDNFYDEFVDGEINLMLVRGRGGTGKSRRLQPYIDKGQIVLISGCTITPFDLYCKLYKFRDQPIVIDDIDYLWRDSKCVNLLKGICQTEKTKVLSWNTSKLSDPTGDPDDSSVNSEKPPNTFETTSRIMIIANSWQVSDANLAALMTRGIDITFEPSGREVHEEAKKFCYDPRVVEFIAQWAPIVKVNFRDYVNAATVNRRGRLPWKQMLLDSWGVSRALVFVHFLENDPAWKAKTWNSRVAEFSRQRFPQGSSKSRYYELKAQLEQGRNPRGYVIQTIGEGSME